MEYICERNALKLYVTNFVSWAQRRRQAAGVESIGIEVR